MKVRSEKTKGEYHIDSKQITAKKGKKNYDSFTPNSLSTSHNHHKYQKYEEIIQENNDKETITIKQFQSFVRSLRKYYRKSQAQSMEKTQKKSILVEKLYYYLRHRYTIIGEPSKIEKIQASIREIIPQRPKICELCMQNGIKCNQIQLNYFQQILPNDIQSLEHKLDELMKQNQKCHAILEDQKKPASQQRTIQELKSIIKEQQQTIKQLQEQETSKQPKDPYYRKKQKKKLEIYIDEDQP